jgi:hypothetical protein
VLGPARPDGFFWIAAQRPAKTRRRGRGRMILDGGARAWIFRSAGSICGRKLITGEYVWQRLVVRRNSFLVSIDGQQVVSGLHQRQRRVSSPGSLCLTYRYWSRRTSLLRHSHILFTHLEGSTRLGEQYPRMKEPGAMAILRRAIRNIATRDQDHRRGVPRCSRPRTEPPRRSPTAPFGLWEGSSPTALKRGDT